MKTIKPSAISRQLSAKTGVVLLVILGLLAVLALLGIMFTSLSGSEESSAHKYFTAFANERSELPADAVLYPTLGQIVADTNLPISVLLGHSLLRDMYGNDSDLADFLGNPAPNGRIDASERYRRAFNGPGDRGADDMIGSADDADPNFVFNGRRPERPLPLVPGQLAGGFDEDFDAADHQNMFLGAISWAQASGSWVPVVLAPSYHRPGLINPATWKPPGGGAVWLSIDDWGDNYLESGVFKVFPKSVQDTAGGATTYPAARGKRLILRPRPIDHLSEYDKSQIRNKRTPVPAFGLDQAPGRLNVDDDDDGIIDYDRNTGLWDLGELGYPGSDDPGLRRPLAGTYDVDNDGDGVIDSVWLDPGLPVQRTLDGKRFKPMVAILCIDMDGKLNLNAHGAIGHDKLRANGQWVFPGSAGDGIPDSHPDLASSVHTGVANLVVALGSGASPTEINLQNLFSPDPLLYSGLYAPGSAYSAREFQWILEGRRCGRTLVPGRYGEESLLLASTPPRPGITSRDNDWPRLPYKGYTYFGDQYEGVRFGTMGPDNKPGVAGVDDDNNGTVDDATELGWPGSDDGQYRRPADLDGDGATWVSILGQHVYGPWSASYRFLGSGGNQLGWTNNWGETDPARPENVNEADELNLYSPVGSDRPFTVRDLEALYRFHDMNGHLLASGLVGPDGRPGRAGVDEDGVNGVDDINELGWPGSDDIILRGVDGRPGVAGTDDDGVNGTDDIGELGWPGSDDVANSRLGVLAPSLFDRLIDSSLAAKRRRMLTTESWDYAGFSMFPLLKDSNVAPGEGIETAGNLNVPESTQTAANPKRWPVRGNGQFNHKGLHAVAPGGVGPVVVQYSGEPAGRAARLAPGLVWLPGPDGHPGRAAYRASVDAASEGQWQGNDDHDPSATAAPGLQNEADELGWDKTDDFWLPAFLAIGRRLDLNRPFLNFPPSSPGGKPYFASTSVTSPNDPRTLARDIYILLRQLRPTTDPDAIERMAQFAVNVVDFRDADDIMTGFEYDKDLSNGWNVDGNITTEDETPNPAGGATSLSKIDRGVVWGVEAPRIVINETFSFETAANGVQLWFELYNPGLPAGDDPNSAVDLAPRDAANNKQPAYQVILSNRFPNATTGEPDLAVGRKFAFEPPPGGATITTTSIPGSSYYLVGPNGIQYSTDPMAPPGSVDYDTRSNAFFLTLTDIGDTWRLYLRRLADPNLPPDAGPDGTLDTSDDLNPYITVDALDVRIFSQMAATPMTGLPTHASYQRKDPYSVGRELHAAGSMDPHTLKAQNLQGPLPGTPYTPYTTLTFNDRPFVSPMELLLVPGVRPQWLTTAFVRPSTDMNPFNPQPIQEDTSATCFKTGEARDPNKPFAKIGATPPDYYFGHLLNFLREDSTGGAVPTPGYYRLLEFVEVPSRMNGSRNAFLNPNLSDDRLDRVPGKLNINTIYEPEILLALLNNHPAALVDPTGAPISSPGGSAIWQWLKASRDGWDGILGSVDDRPFRSFTVGATSNITNTTTTGSGFWPPSIHSTLLRGTVVPVHPDVTATPSLTTKSPDRPSFQDDRGQAPPGMPLGSLSSMRGFNYFQNQPLSKIGNLVTTRSNVYAVWITVGFFEVLAEPAANELDDDGDGIVDEPGELMPRLGQEVGILTNRTVRHRGFYIIDRSRAKGYAGPPRSPSELKDVLNDVVIYSRIIE